MERTQIYYVQNTKNFCMKWMYKQLLLEEESRSLNIKDRPNYAQQGIIYYVYFTYVYYVYYVYYILCIFHVLLTGLLVKIID